MTDITLNQRGMKALAKQANQQRDRLNRIAKLAPGMDRIFKLSSLADLMQMEADMTSDEATAASWEADALFLRRLAWDLAQLRAAARGVSARDTYPSHRHWIEDGEERP